MELSIPPEQECGNAHQTVGYRDQPEVPRRRARRVRRPYFYIELPMWVGMLNRMPELSLKQTVFARTVVCDQTILSLTLDA
ncbi:hypothetical protein PT974_10223 [Cladobotryum mycophilum]|uniref:Uncharacterized protein n=1 Tax=Cladobotryum mycophilum TaxID=491253 RepID=A0ABR0S998_9HYPO